MSQPPGMQVSTCPLCEAMCGVLVEVDGRRIRAVRGDPDDPFSRGYICPKAAALADLHDDPDRLRTPLVRKGRPKSRSCIDTTPPMVRTGPRGAAFFVLPAFSA